jgi:hypothetical protein
MRKAAHESFSPQLVPSDLHLFGKMKTTLTGETFEENNKLLFSIPTVLTIIVKRNLKYVSKE